jgi:hypothetical protein
MSTLVAQTISNGTVSTSSANVIQGSAKAWVSWSAATGSNVIKGSYNVSSVTLNSTGNHTVNFTNALPNANYAAMGTGKNDNNATVASNNNPLNLCAFNYLTTSVQFVSVASVTLINGTNLQIAIFST